LKEVIDKHINNTSNNKDSSWIILFAENIRDIDMNQERYTIENIK
jgi:hypothetical protein